VPDVEAPATPTGKVHYKVHGGALVIKDQQSAPWKE
jgi:hypothetical protein